MRTIPIGMIQVIPMILMILMIPPDQEHRWEAITALSADWFCCFFRSDVFSVQVKIKKLKILTVWTSPKLKNLAKILEIVKKNPETFEELLFQSGIFQFNLLKNYQL